MGNLFGLLGFFTKISFLQFVQQSLDQYEFINKLVESRKLLILIILIVLILIVDFVACEIGIHTFWDISSVKFTFNKEWKLFLEKSHAIVMSLLDAIFGHFYAHAVPIIIGPFRIFSTSSNFLPVLLSTLINPENVNYQNKRIENKKMQILLLQILKGAHAILVKVLIKFLVNT